MNQIMMAAKTICENLNQLRKRIREADLHGNDFQTGNFLVNPYLSLSSFVGKTSLPFVGTSWEIINQNGLVTAHFELETISGPFGSTKGHLH